MAASERVSSQLLSLPFAPASGYVAGYWAMDGEIGLHAFQLRLPTSLTYCLPVLHPDGLLRFAPWKPGDPPVTNRHGIPEPDVNAEDALEARQLTLVVLPLVGFDAGCQRVIADAGRVVGRAVADLCNYLNPDLVVVGGDLSAAGDLVLEPMREAVRRFAIPAFTPVLLNVSIIAAAGGVERWSRAVAAYCWAATKSPRLWAR